MSLAMNAPAQHLLDLMQNQPSVYREQSAPRLTDNEERRNL